MSEFWFRSTRFEIEPGEDEATNPCCYGKQAAYWLQSGLRASGYPEAEVIAEDWGWCVLCQRRPVRLWVGCGNVRSDPGVERDGTLPDGRSVVWHCFVIAEPGIVQRLLGRARSDEARARLSGAVERLLRQEPTLTLVAEP